jgi:hypothetical protein
MCFVAKGDHARHQATAARRDRQRSDLEYATLLFDDIEFASVLSLITAAFLAEQPDVWPTPAIAIIAKPSREAVARNYDRSLIRIMPRPPSQKP